MTLTGTRFGTVEYNAEDLLSFPEGLVGFTSLRRFLLLETSAQGPFRWLQSLDEPNLAFLLAKPEHLVAGYDFELPGDAAAALDIGASTPRLVLATASIPKGRPTELTLNLAGPIVINVLTKCGKQLVLEDAAYTIRHRVFTEANEVDGRAAA